MYSVTAPAWFQTGSSDCKVIMSASAHIQIKIIVYTLQISLLCTNYFE